MSIHDALSIAQRDSFVPVVFVCILLFIVPSDRKSSLLTALLGPLKPAVSWERGV